MNKQAETATVFILAIALLGAAAISPIMSLTYASTSEEDEEAPPEEDTTAPAPATPTPPTTLGSTIVPPTTTSTPAPAASATDFVRARVMLFGIPPTSPNVVAWINVPSENATSADTVTGPELDASNNVTGDGIGEIFITLPNVTSQVNQQIQACALDVVDLRPQCDDAFTASTNASTTLQILLGQTPGATAPSAAAAAPTTAATGGA